jgi:hypothetical protein
MTEEKLSEGLVTYVFHYGKTTVPNKITNHVTWYGNIAGMAHCQAGIQALYQYAKVLGRKMVLPPVNQTLQTGHNDPWGNLPDDVKWTRYFDFGDIETDIVDIRIHQTYPVLGRLSTDHVVYVDADTELEKMAKVPHHKVLAISFYNSAKYKIFEVSKFAPNLVERFTWKPSKLVTQLRDAVIKQTGSNLVAVHVRRGDVITKGHTDYGGCTWQQLRQITSPEFIANSLSEFGAKSDDVVIVFSNESDDSWWAELREALDNYENVFDEKEVEAFKYIRHKYADGFLAYQVAREIFSNARIRVSTANDRLGSSTHKLKDRL